MEQSRKRQPRLERNAAIADGEVEKRPKVVVNARDGATYDGEWKIGTEEWHGMGILTGQGQPTYEGNFFNGEMHGYGRLTFPNKSELTCVFKHGQPDGHVELLNPLEIIYRGEYSELQNNLQPG